MDGRERVPREPSLLTVTRSNEIIEGFHGDAVKCMERAYLS